MTTSADLYKENKERRNSGNIQGMLSLRQLHLKYFVTSGFTGRSTTLCYKWLQSIQYLNWGLQLVRLFKVTYIQNASCLSCLLFSTIFTFTMCHIVAEITDTK